MAQYPLEIVLQSKFSSAKSEIIGLTSATEKFRQVVGSAITTVNKLNGSSYGTAIYKSLDDAKTATVKFNEAGQIVKSTIKETAGESSKLKKVFDIAFDVNKLYFYWNLTKRLRDGIKSIINSSIDFVETENMFNVSMNTAAEQARRFVNITSEAVGISQQTLMQYQATFKNILSGLGDFTDRQSERISESLVKMSLDYSSLFNVDQDKSMEKFQGALTGSIRPIRSDSGYDVSETAISVKAQELGVQRSVAQLNQMEKRILRIIVLMEQLKNTGAFNDLARTIESPSNQMKVLQQQIQEVGIWLGNVFIGTVGAILPYINGFVMVIKELIKMFAVFVGYKGDTASGLTDAFEVADSSVGGINSGLGDANQKAKELKKTLMGFDVLNVITTPTESKKNGGSGSGGMSVDPAILSALEDYNNMMENVRMKATDIRDKIMDWLGFIKDINPLTGEISWIMRDGLTNIEKILDVVKAIGIALLSWKVSKSALGIWELFTGKRLGKLNKANIATSLAISISGIYIAYKGISHMLDGDIEIFSLLETFLGTAAGSFGLVSLLAKAMSRGKHAKVISLGSKLKLSFGIALAVTSITFSVSAIKKNYDKMVDIIYGDVEKSSLNTLQKINVSIQSIFYEIGAIISNTWIKIQEFFGLLSEDEEKLLENNKKISDSITTIVKQYEEQVNSIRDNANEKLLDIEYSNKLYEELTKIVDQNGKIQQGYETRANFIVNELNSALGTEYELNNNIISNYQDMQREIAGIIEQRKIEIETEAYSEMYKESLKEKLRLSMEYKEALTSRNEALKEYNIALENGEKPSQIAITNLEKSNDNLNKMKEYLLECDEQTSYYATNLEANMLKSNGSIEEAKNVMNNYQYEVSQDIQNMINSADNWQLKSNELKNSIQQDGISQIQTYEDVKKAMQSTETQSQTSADKIKSAFNSLNTVGEALDSPLGRLFENLNINNPIGWASKIISAAANLAKSISDKLNISANLNANISGGANISARAMGGPVSVGELFIAREAGPELVGAIGNTTAVMNNQQIVQAVSTGVAQAVSRVMGGNQKNITVPVYLDSSLIYEETYSLEDRENNIRGR